MAAALAALVVPFTADVAVAGAAGPGPTWSGVSVPLPPDAGAAPNAEVDGTSCPAAGSCAASGQYSTATASALFVDTLSGGSWTSVRIPDPPNLKAGFSQPYFTALSCPVSTNWCTAVGNFTDSSSHAQGFAATLSGGTWTVSLLPLPPADVNPGVRMANSSLACPAPGHCVATGAFDNPTHNPSTFIAQLSGSTWSSIEAPLPPDAASPANAELFAASCASVDSCAAVGPYRSTTGGQSVIEVLAAGTWSPVEAPIPANGAADPEANLDGVSCPAPGVCVAAGYYTATNGHSQNLIETQAGMSVSPTEVPQPGDAVATSAADLNDVSCPTVTACVAVGGYVNGSGPATVPEVATLSGGNWTSQSAPGAVAGDDFAVLNTVDCSWPGSCVAEGTTSTFPNDNVIIDSLTAGVWSGNNVAFPPGVLFSFAGVAPSCVAGTCLVGGSYATAGPVGNAFLNTFPNLTGYQEVASDGGLFSFNAPFYGSMGGAPLNAPIVGMTVVPDSGGCYEAASDGGVFAFNAPFQGSMGGRTLNSPVVGITFDTRTGGYYEVAADGGIFAFNAPYYGSMGGKPLDSPVVGMAFDPLTGGYYEVAADGGLFAFNAPFQGSMGGKPIVKPIVGMEVDPQTGGYYEVAADGGLFAFGAPFQGSMGGKPLNHPMVGIAFDYVTGGYEEVASDGGLFAFNAPFFGSMGGSPLNRPIVGMAFG